MKLHNLSKLPTMKYDSSSQAFKNLIVLLAESKNEEKVMSEIFELLKHSPNRTIASEDIAKLHKNETQAKKMFHDVIKKMVAFGIIEKRVRLDSKGRLFYLMSKRHWKWIGKYRRNYAMAMVGQKTITKKLYREMR